MVVGLVIGSVAAPSVRAAGPWTGLYVDGPDGEPISGSLQHLYTPPTDIIQIVDAAADHSMIEVSVAAWTLRFEDRDGDPLAVGTYGSHTVTGHDGYHGFVLTGPGGTCPDAFGQFDIREISWDGDTVDGLAIDWEQICDTGGPQVVGSLRYLSTIPIVGLANSPGVVDLGQTTVGVPSAPHDVTFTSIGQAAVQFGSAYVDGNRQGDVVIVADGCSGSTLAPGATCAIRVRMTGVAPALDTIPQLVVPEDTPRQNRIVFMHATIRAATSTTMAVDPDRAYWPAPTYVSATVTPHPDGGVVRFDYDDGHGTMGSVSTTVSGSTITAAVIIPRGQYTWSATFEGHGPYDPSASAPVLHATGLETTTTLTAATFPIGLGDVATLTAQVRPPDGFPLPSGTVTVRGPTGSVVGSGPVGGDVQSLVVHVSGLALGTHLFTASYVSSADGQASQGSFRLGVRSTGIGVAWAVDPPPSTGQTVFARLAPAPGGVFALGRTGGALDGLASAGGNDVWVARYDDDGSILWTRQFGSVLHDDPLDIASTKDAVYMLYAVPADQYEPGFAVAQDVLVKLDLGGTELWRRAIDRDANFWGTIAATPSGGVALAATPPAPSDILVQRPALLRIYRADGSVAWEDPVVADPGQTGFAWATDVATDSNGVTFVGTRTVSPSASVGAFVRRYSLDGHLLWERIVADDAHAPVIGFVAAGDSGIRVAGTSQQPITDTPNAFPAPNYFVRAYGFDGSIQWTRSAMTAQALGDCSSFITMGWVEPAPLTDVYHGAYLDRSSRTGAVAWRWEVAGAPDQWVEFRDVAGIGPQLYVIQIVSTISPASTTETLVAVDGIPPRTDCDTKAPTVTAPGRSFVTGSEVVSGRVPLRVRWTGTDGGSGVARYRLEQSTDGHSWTLASADVTRSYLDRPVSSGHAYRFRVTAVDGAGNASQRATGPTLSVSRYGETDGHISYSGRWGLIYGGDYWGVAVKSSSQAGAKATIRFTGRNFAWVGTTGPNRGKAEIYVDGTKVATVDLRSNTTQNRRVIWTKSWSSSTSRRVTIKVLGTSGRPRVDIDGVAISN